MVRKEAQAWDSLNGSIDATIGGKGRIDATLPLLGRKIIHAL